MCKGVLAADSAATNAAPRSEIARLGHPSMTGIQFLQVDASTLPGEVEADDLLLVDFDQRRVRKDGLYVIQLGNWTGVRRFVDTIDGPRVLDVDRWRPVGATVRILGYVDTIYTPRRALRLDQAHEAALGAHHG